MPKDNEVTSGPAAGLQIQILEDQDWRHWSACQK